MDVKYINRDNHNLLHYQCANCGSLWNDPSAIFTLDDKEYCLECAPAVLRDPIKKMIAEGRW